MSHRRLVLALVLLVACKRPTPTGAPDAAPDAVADVATAGPFHPVSHDGTDGGTPTSLALDGGFAALLEGKASAARLPEIASDPDYDFDRTLREQLTTVTETHGEGLGSIGHGVNDEPAVERRRKTGPNAVVTLGRVTATSPMPDADRVVAGLRPRFRQCYQAALNGDPSMVGTAIVTARITKEGEIASADAAVVGISSAVGACLAGVVRNHAGFAPPGGGAGATLTIPLTLAVGT